MLFWLQILSKGCKIYSS